MAEETVDIIEETDDINDWICYTGEPKTQESTDLNTFTDIEAKQHLICVDTSLVENINEQTFQYDPDDNNLISNEGFDQDLPYNDDEMEEQAQQTNDISKHNLILKESIDENGQLVEDYFCQHCNISFKSIEEFLICHPSIELLDDNTQQVEQKEFVPSTATQDKLWDLVENLDEEENFIDEDFENVKIEIKPNVTRHNDESLQHDAVELDNERYFCYDCQQVFTDLAGAENHDCGNQLQSSNNITEAEPSFLEGNDNGIAYRCILCDKDYATLRLFNNHKRWHTKSEDHILGHTKKSYNETAISKTKDHHLGHTKKLYNEPAICEICNTIFASEKNLKLHMKMHKKHAIKTIQEALPVGAQSEYDELNKFFCEICNKSFDQKLLVIHKNMHQNLEQYTCGKCNKKFENLPSYEIHMQMHVDTLVNAKKVNDVIIAEEAPSTSAKRKHACQYCGKEFQRPYEKVKHERIHTGEKPYECEVCGKTFRVSYSLTLHLRTHTDIRPYVCATCNKRFKQQSVYVHHLKTHAVERGYKCDICGKGFRTSVQLSGHKNIHSKPYNCTECNRPFASLYSVKIHMKTHNKCHKSNKNLKNRCHLCGASYARAFALHYHIKEQHGIDAYPTKMLEASSATSNLDKELDAETALLMDVANDASSRQINFINNDYEEGENDEDYGNDNGDDGIFNSHIDHEEKIQNSFPDNVYLDETEAATQTILNTEEIIVDHFHNEEIIAD